MKKFIFSLMAIGMIGSSSLLTSCGAEEEPMENDEEIEDITTQLGLESDEEETYVNTGLLEMEEYMVAVPTEWMGEEPKNGMRVAQYKITEETETMTYVTKLPKKGSPMGDFSDPSVIMNKWKSEFTNSANEIEKDYDMGAKMYAVQGTYVHTDMATGNSTKYDDYMMMAGYIPTENSVYSVKMVGPKTEVEAEKERFMNLMSSIKLAGSAENEAM